MGLQKMFGQRCLGVAEFGRLGFAFCAFSRLRLLKGKVLDTGGAFGCRRNVRSFCLVGICGNSFSLTENNKKKW